MITIIDYGMGNLGSIYNMFKKVGAESIVSSNVSDIEKASKLVLPGVGAFDRGMDSLDKSGLLPVLNEKILNKKTPVLGICLGMQLMTRGSEEGKSAGLGWIDANTIRFDLGEADQKLKVPHMGWNLVTVKKESPLFDDISEEPRFYFVHSYHVVCNREEDILSTTAYGYEFVSAFQKGNIFGAQFHPEKSHKFGMRFFKNFSEL